MLVVAVERLRKKSELICTGLRFNLFFMHTHALRVSLVLSPFHKFYRIPYFLAFHTRSISFVACP